MCGEACEWDAIAYRDEDDNPPSNPPSCGDRITFVINQEGKSALEACAQVAAEFPDICGMCEPIIPTDDWTDEPTPTPTAGPMPAPTIPRDACGEPCKVFTIDAMPYSTDEDGDPDGGCYVVKGTFVDAFNDILQVKSDCAKITVPKDSSVSNIFARLPRPFFAPPRETLRRGARRIGLMPWRSSSTANPTASMRASCVRRPLLFLCSARHLSPAPAALLCLEPEDNDYRHRHQRRPSLHLRAHTASYRLRRPLTSPARAGLEWRSLVEGAPDHGKQPGPSHH